MDHSRRYISDLQLTLSRLPIDLIEQVISILHAARLSNRRVFVMGNGGSASTASHFACDLGKNTRRKGWPNFQVLGLTDNMAVFSALANDEGYENVFAQQLASFVQPDDVVIGISTSGNSANVVNAIKLANRMGAKTVGFTGFDSGRLGNLVDINLHVPSDSIEQVEDIHLMLEHLITKALREATRRTTVVDQPLPISTEDPVAIADPIAAPVGAVLESVKPNIPELDLAFQELISGLSREMDSSLDQFNLLQRVLQFCRKSVDAHSGCVLLVNEKEEATQAALAYMDKVEVYATQHLADILEGGLAGWVVKNRRPVLVPNTLEDDRWFKRPWEGKNGSRSAVSVPFVDSEQVLGVLTLVHPKAGRFTQNDLALLASLAMYVTLMALKPFKIDL
ncbi:MAG: SIS domain-containing protein [Anaerolineales bacterium]|jgi:D-sedoheptulose 7-phosphate isomerase